MAGREAAGREAARQAKAEASEGLGTMIYRGLRVALERRSAYRKTVDELRGLDPRLLRDIGVEPQDIERVAGRAASGEARRRL
ncbi:MAG: DUF1127 domain-containing protein [Pseudomonadota bacterium]